jgi:hypothetical protein
MTEDPTSSLEMLARDADLAELVRELGRFNLFHVLGAASHELRHSNMLAWLLDPQGSHGLRDRFLRSFLRSAAGKRPEGPSVAEVDSWSFESVKVWREWSYLDILLELELGAGPPWAIAIENKVEATQRENQLSDYRNRVERSFSKARHWFIFLTKHDEQPQDGAHWTCVRYSDISEVLTSSLATAGVDVPLEQGVLIRHYQNIVKEHTTVRNDKAAQLARALYNKHRSALDFLFDEIRGAPGALSEELKIRVRDEGLPLLACNETYVRFLPNVDWNCESNLAGKAWGHSDSAFVLCELELRADRSLLKIIAGKPPAAARAAFEQVIASNPDLVGGRPSKPGSDWMTLFSDRLPPGDGPQAADAVWGAVMLVRESDRFKKALALYTPLLGMLTPSGP